MDFWRKPIGDRDTFKLMLFCLGNGCSPNLISRWILVLTNLGARKGREEGYTIRLRPEQYRRKKKHMVLLRPGSQETVVPRRPAETVKPSTCSMHKENNKKHPQKSAKTLHCRRKQTASLGATKCIKDNELL